MRLKRASVEGVDTLDALIAIEIRAARPGEEAAIVPLYAWLFASPGSMPAAWDERRAAIALRQAIDSHDACVLVAGQTADPPAPGGEAEEARPSPDPPAPGGEAEEARPSPDPPAPGGEAEEARPSLDPPAPGGEAEEARPSPDPPAPGGEAEEARPSLDPPAPGGEAEEAGGTFLGLCTVYQDLHSVRFGYRAWVEDLAVDPARRSEGIGALLLGAARDWARERGATHLELDSGEARPDAHRFYEREGAAYRSICFGWEL